MSTSVSFQIKSIVETFTAESAKITFYITVTFQMPIKQSLQVEAFRAQATRETRFAVTGRLWLRNFFDFGFLQYRYAVLIRVRILNTVTAVHKFDGHVAG